MTTNIHPTFTLVGIIVITIIIVVVSIVIIIMTVVGFAILVIIAVTLTHEDGFKGQTTKPPIRGEISLGQAGGFSERKGLKSCRPSPCP